MFFVKTANKTIFSEAAVLKCFLTNIKIGIMKTKFSKKPLFLSGTNYMPMLHFQYAWYVLLAYGFGIAGWFFFQWGRKRGFFHK